MHPLELLLEYHSHVLGLHRFAKKKKRKLSSSVNVIILVERIFYDKNHSEGYSHHCRDEQKKNYILNGNSMMSLVMSHFDVLIQIIFSFCMSTLVSVEVGPFNFHY